MQKKLEKVIASNPVYHEKCVIGFDQEIWSAIYVIGVKRYTALFRVQFAVVFANKSFNLSSAVVSLYVS